MTYNRPAYTVLLKHLSERRRFIQVLAGPRQVGKTTVARQVLQAVRMPAHYASADDPVLRDRFWLEQQWGTARSLIRDEERQRPGLLILDEVHKTSGWSEVVKRLWDEDTAAGLPLHVVLLGSSPLLVQSGLTESLAGRFELIRLPHWSFGEMAEAFAWGLEEFVFYGGYPGAAALIEDHQRWAAYIMDSLVETSISRDVLLMTRVDKPALLRRVFELGCAYSGQVLSYQKMLGQLRDAGSTVTLAHYLELLGGAGLLMGLPKYAGQRVRQRGSSPKLLALNTALMSAASHRTLVEARQDTEFWGRLVESAVGAGLVAALTGTQIELFYWAGRNCEVDYVLARGKAIVPIEVKSGRRKTSLPGIQAFADEFRVKRPLLVGADGIPLDEFLLTPPGKWFD